MNSVISAAFISTSGTILASAIPVIEAYLKRNVKNGIRIITKSGKIIEADNIKLSEREGNLSISLRIDKSSIRIPISEIRTITILEVAQEETLKELGISKWDNIKKYIADNNVAFWVVTKLVDGQKTIGEMFIELEKAGFSSDLGSLGIFLDELVNLGVVEKSTVLDYSLTQDTYKYLLSTEPELEDFILTRTRVIDRILSLEDIYEKLVKSTWEYVFDENDIKQLRDISSNLVSGSKELLELYKDFRK